MNTNLDLHEDALPIVDAVNSKQALSMASRQETAGAAVRILQAIEDLPPRTQVMAVSAVFWLFFQSARLTPNDVLGYVGNMARDERHPERIHPTFAGLRHYLNTWLLDRRAV